MSLTAPLRTALWRLGLVPASLSSRRVLVALLILASLALRLDGIALPPMDFHPTRQYHSAIIARAYYLEISAPPSPKLRRAALTAGNDERLVEPPVLELVAALAYRVSGGERLWIPRLLSVVFWLVGALFLMSLARRMTSANGVVVALAVYLMLPFGILASRSFQPDPLMIMLLISSAMAVLRYHEMPSPSRFAATSATSALATFTKPGICLLFLVPLYCSLELSRRGLKRALTSGAVAAFAALSFAPSGIYYLYGTRVADFLDSQVGEKVVPQLLAEPFYWVEWLRMATRVLAAMPSTEAVKLGLGLVLLLLALAGVMLVPRGLPRATLVGLWGGYLLYGLVFANHIHTHDYYSLPLIPIVALSLAPLGARGLDLVGRLSTRWRVVGALGFVVMATAAGVTADQRLRDPEYVATARIAEQIGRLTDHSTRIVFLDKHYGAPLKYHGWTAGRYWPSLLDQSEERLHGLRTVSAAERFRGRDPAYYPPLGALRVPPEFFVVVDLAELDAQDDLRVFLRSRFPERRTDRFSIFYLEQKARRARTAAATIPFD